jgi:hypothetical protein
MVLSIQTTVTVSFGATYGFQLSLHSSRVTKLLAQFVDALPRGKTWTLGGIYDFVMGYGR